jgi:hypothetical protein
MKYLSILLSLVLLTGCVSSRLAESNRKSVEALATVAVQEDETNVPLAEESVATADEIVAATGVFKQMTNFGVPADLTEQNYQNVEELVVAVEGSSEPRVGVVVDRARANAGELAGKARAHGAFKQAVSTVPWGSTIIELLGIIGGAGVATYGATRGRKHAWRWVGGLGKKAEGPPNANGPA